MNERKYIIITETHYCNRCGRNYNVTEELSKNQILEQVRRFKSDSKKFKILVNSDFNLSNGLFK